MRGLDSEKTKLVFAQLNAQNIRLKTRMCSSPVRLRDSLILINSRKNESMSYIFRIEIVIKERELLSLLLLIVSGKA